jgi:Zn-dependent protease
MSTSADGPPTISPEAGNPGLRLGSIGGVPIYLSASWFVIAAIIVLTFGPDVRASVPGVGAGGAYLVALVYALLLAVSVLCHEAAHAVVARRSGYVVQRIVVNLWGGHTAFSAPAPTPGRSALVSVSGPIANALLALAGLAVLPLLPPGVPRLLGLAWTISNAFVTVFNLLPGLPLDGGFLVDALVWRITGRRSAGMVAAGWGGRLITLAGLLYFVIIPLLSGGLSLWSVAWFAFIGAFLWSGASGAIAAGASLRVLEAVPLAAVARPVVPVPLEAPALEVPARLTASPGAVPVLVDPGGRPRGLVDPQAWQRMPAGDERATPASALLLRQPRGWLAPYDPQPGATVAAYLAALVENPYGVVVLTDPAGHPIAAVTAADVERAGAEQPVS